MNEANKKKAHWSVGEMKEKTIFSLVARSDARSV